MVASTRKIYMLVGGDINIVRHRLRKGKEKLVETGLSGGGDGGCICGAGGDA